jgi:hypothetical protein
VRPRDGYLNPGAAREYVWQTGDLFLRTREALDQNRIMTIESGDVPSVAAAG